MGTNVYSWDLRLKEIGLVLTSPNMQWIPVSQNFVELDTCWLVTHMYNYGEVWLHQFWAHMMRRRCNVVSSTFERKLQLKDQGLIHIDPRSRQSTVNNRNFKWPQGRRVLDYRNGEIYAGWTWAKVSTWCFLQRWLIPCFTENTWLQMLAEYRHRPARHGVSLWITTWETWIWALHFVGSWTAKHHQSHSRVTNRRTLMCGSAVEEHGPIAVHCHLVNTAMEVGP